MNKIIIANPGWNFIGKYWKVLGKLPHQCMMVGNDVEEDMVASRLGIKTYLITDHLINSRNNPIICDYQGTYEDFYSFVCKLPEAGRKPD